MRLSDELIIAYSGGCMPQVTNEQLIDLIAQVRRKDREFADWLIKQIKPKVRRKVSIKRVKQLIHE